MSERRRFRLRTRWVIGIRLSDLHPTTTLVALTLAGFADGNGLRARPSVSSIAQGCRLQRRVVTDHVRMLEQAGFIRRVHGRGVPNEYVFLIPLEIELKIEAQLGEWTEEVGHGDALPVRHGDALPVAEVGHEDAPSKARGRPNYGTPMPTSLTEPVHQPQTAGAQSGPPATDEGPIGFWTRRGGRSEFHYLRGHEPKTGDEEQEP